MCMCERLKKVELATDNQTNIVLCFIMFLDKISLVMCFYKIILYIPFVLVNLSI